MGISRQFHMMHGHTYIKFNFMFIYNKRHYLQLYTVPKCCGHILCRIVVDIHRTELLWTYTVTKYWGNTPYRIVVVLIFCGPCNVINLCNKNHMDALFYSQFFSIINPYTFQGLLLIIRRYFSVYTAIGMCHAFMLAGC